MNTPRTSPVVGKRKLTPREHRRHTLHRMAKTFSYVDSANRQVFVSNEQMNAITFDQLFVLAELAEEYGYRLRLRAIPFKPENPKNN